MKVRVKEITYGSGKKIFILQYKILFFWIVGDGFNSLEGAENALSDKTVNPIVKYHYGPKDEP